MQEGSWDKAERMLNKSIRLHENDEAKNLLSNLDEIKKRFQYNTKPSSNTSTGQSQQRKKTPSPEKKREFTDEQAKICREIIN